MDDEIPPDLRDAATALRSLLAAHRHVHAPACDGGCMCGWGCGGGQDWAEHRRSDLVALVAGAGGRADVQCKHEGASIAV
jgi:hypothetical protein